MKVTEVFKKNLKAYNQGYRTIVNRGGARSSKTWSLLQLFHFIAANSSKHRKISIVSQSFPHLSDGVVYDFSTHLENEGINPDKLHNKSGHFFRLNKSIVNYFSADDTGKVKGPARDILLLNEPNHGISYDVYNALNIRTKETVFMDYNPSGKFWLHNQKILEEKDTFVIHSTWLDNIDNLTDAQKNEFIRAYRKSKVDPYWKYWYDVYGLGKDSVLIEERIFPFLNLALSVPDDAVEIPSGLDFGFNPDPTCLIRCWVKKNDLKDDLYVKPVIYDTKLSINTKSEGQENLTEKLDQNGFNKNHLIIAESADPRSIKEMRSAGFNIIAVKKTLIETSIRLFHDYNIHFVGEEGHQVYQEMDNYKYKRDPKTNEILPIPEKSQPDHGIDALRYVLLSRNYRWSV